MNIASFFTLQIQTPGQAGPAGHQALGGPAGVNALGFLDFLLAQLGQKQDETEQTPGALQSDNPLLDKKPSLDIAELLAANPEIAEDVKTPGTTPEEQLAQILALNQKAFDEILKPFMNADGTITINGKTVKIDPSNKAELVIGAFQVNGEAANRPALLQLKQLLEAMESGVDEDGSPVMIATNLTPEQIAALKQKIDDILAGNSTKDDDAVLNEVLIAMVHIVPRHEKPAAGAAAEGEIADELAAISSDHKGLEEDGTGFLKQQPDNTGGKKDHAPVLNKAEGALKAENLALQSWKFSPDGSFHTPMPSFDDMMQSWGYGPHGPSSISSLQNAANPVMQSSQASLPVPATQIVAATIQKAAQDGESKNIRLQLEPPELGRVEVRMSFGKDKTVKAVLLAEKPETVTMLQRDSYHLERALFDSGLDANGSSLSFELAGEGYDFNQNGGHDSQGGGGAAQADDGDMIETTMNWYVDPETGLTRYNLLV